VISRNGRESTIFSHLIWVHSRFYAGGKGNRLLPGRVQFEGEDFGVGLEIGVGGKKQW